jgi:hypothetical protein
MPRDGSGNFSFTNADFVAGTTISVTPMNAKFSEVATALTASIAKDGQTTAAADLPMGAFKHTNVANGSARNHYAAVGQVQDSAFAFGGNAVFTTSSNVYAITMAPAITAYASGQSFLFYASNTSSGSNAEVNVNGAGKKQIRGSDNRVLRGGEIVAGELQRITYDGTVFRMPPLPIEEYLESVTLAGTASSVAFTLPANYRAFNIYYDNVRSAGAGGDTLVCYMSATSTFAYASNYALAYSRGPSSEATATNFATGSASYITFALDGLVASTGNGRLAGRVLIYPGRTNVVGHLIADSISNTVFAAVPVSHRAHARTVTGVATSIQLRGLAADLLSGTFTLAGIRG